MTNATRHSAVRQPAAPPLGSTRLLAGLEDRSKPVRLGEHLARWGELPDWGRPLVDEVQAAGLVGHGGAWFPVATKWRSVEARRLRRPVIVANGAEGEPASRKDALLLSLAPHLVLDGAMAAARAVGATRVVAYVGRRHVAAVAAAVADRRRAGLDPVAIEVAVSPDAFLAGQESAAVNVLNGSERPLPSFTAIRSVRDRGVAGRPTVVHNVETLAHVALIARFGARWFRRVGDGGNAGTMLLTVSGRWGDPTVVEAPIGGSLADLLRLDPAIVGNRAGALLGGYGGGWVSMHALAGLPLDELAARRIGTSLGAGVVALLPRDVCPLVEVAAVVDHLRRHGAGQCGPCANGLPQLADLMWDLALGGPHARRTDVGSITELCALVEGRGACRHPDGVARFVRSACLVFAEEIAIHERRGPCRFVARERFLPVPGVPSRRPSSHHRVIR